jgi:hypothetical protein
MIPVAGRSMDPGFECVVYKGRNTDRVVYVARSAIGLIQDRRVSFTG